MNIIHCLDGDKDGVVRPNLTNISSAAYEPNEAREILTFVWFVCFVVFFRFSIGVEIPIPCSTNVRKAAKTLSAAQFLLTASRIRNFVNISVPAKVGRIGLVSRPNARKLPGNS